MIIGGEKNNRELRSFAIKVLAQVPFLYAKFECKELPQKEKCSMQIHLI